MSQLDFYGLEKSRDLVDIGALHVLYIYDQNDHM